MFDDNELKFLLKRNHETIAFEVLKSIDVDGQVLDGVVTKNKIGSTFKLQTAGHYIIVFAVLAVLLRVFSRRRTGTKLWWDDFFALVAMTFMVISWLLQAGIQWQGYISVGSLLAMIGQQKKLERKRSGIVMALKMFFAFQVLYIISIWCIKLSMLALYKRYAGETPRIKLYLKGTILFCGIAFVYCVLALFLSCVPISMFWTLRKGTESALCSKKPFLIYGSGIFTVITDILVLAVPVPLLLRIRLTKRQKVGVSVLYFFGVFVIIASILRFASQVANVTVLQTVGWSQIEVGLALILACAPMAAKLLILPLIDTPVVQLRTLRKSNAFVAMSLRSPHNKALPKVPRTEGASAEDLPHVADLERQMKMFPGLDQGVEKKSRRNEVAKSTVLVKEILSPDYHRLKVVLNGQSVWEVRPISESSSRPGTAQSAHTTNSNYTSHSNCSRTTNGSTISRTTAIFSSISSKISGRLGGRTSIDNDNESTQSDIPDIPPIAEQWKHLQLPDKAKK